MVDVHHNWNWWAIDVSIKYSNIQTMLKKLVSCKLLKECKIWLDEFLSPLLNILRQNLSYLIQLIHMLMFMISIS